MYLQLRITNIVKETPGTHTYFFEEATGQPVIYTAGQFLTFIILLHGKEYRRSYSFSSTPGVDDFISVTIREKENGEISRHVLKTWQKGDIVTAVEPSGRFIYQPLTKGPKDVFMLAAGSGITPVYSILKQVLHEDPSASITLIYSNSTPERTIFYQQLLDWQAKYPQQLTCVFLFSNDPDVHHTYRRLNNALLEILVNKHMKHNPADALFYLCGPFDYMRTILLTLTFMGFSADQLHKENFVINTAVKIAKTPLPQETDTRKVILHYRNETTEMQVPANQTILEYALDNNIQLPYSCRGGVCGSCTAQCVSGKVWMSVNEVLTDKELQEGLVLTCVGYPVTEEVILEI
jgi:ring-1,2-phenylacetyl-CoA epoxidase subunit PaaE